MIEQPPFERLVHPGLSVTETKPVNDKRVDLIRLFYKARDDFLRRKREKEKK